MTRRTLIWIASYPKSGNTWLRFMACNLVFGKQESAAALATLVPDVHELEGTFEIPSSSRMFKTHFAWSERLAPLAPFTAGAIYVVRHPADVLVSNFHYARRSGALTSREEHAFAEYVENFIDQRGDQRWVSSGMGNWEQNVLSWYRRDLPFPVLRLRYEDMLADPLACLRKIAKFLGVTASNRRLQEVVVDSSFERLREIEESDIKAKRVGIFYKPYLESSIDAGLRFMHGGRSGAGSAQISEEQQLRLTTALARAMYAAGYASAPPKSIGATASP